MMANDCQTVFSKPDHGAVEYGGGRSSKKRGLVLETEEFDGLLSDHAQNYHEAVMS